MLNHDELTVKTYKYCDIYCKSSLCNKHEFLTGVFESIHLNEFQHSTNTGEKKKHHNMQLHPLCLERKRPNRIVPRKHNQQKASADDILAAPH